MTRRSKVNPALYVPWDIEVARLNFGANCGPSAFAATTGREVCRVMCHFPHFVTSNWTTLTHMRRAFVEAGFVVTVQKRALPTLGVALVQWLGPWTARDFFSRWSLFHTHWIAVHGEHVFDHTIGEWQTLTTWERTVAAEFITNTPRATGWSVKYGIEVYRENNACRGSTNSGLSRDMVSAFSLSS